MDLTTGVDNLTTSRYADEDDDETSSAIQELLWCTVSPILLLTGLSGNILNLITLSGKVLRRRISSGYLIALSIADLGALHTGLLSMWINIQFNVRSMDNYTWICKTRKFLHYSFSDVSVWLICAFTFDRLIAVVFPHKFRLICSKKRSFLVIALILSLAFMKNGSLFATRKLEYDPDSNSTWCTGSDFDRFIRPWIVLALVNIIPFLFISTCNITMIYCFHRMKHSPVQQLHRKNSTQAMVASMTRMCLAVSFAFLILISPSMILLVGRPYWTQDPSSAAKYGIASAAGSLCQYTSNSINFILYCGTGKTFRAQFYQRIRCHCMLRCRDHSSWDVQDNTLSTPEVIQSVEFRNTSNQPCFDQFPQETLSVQPAS